MVKQKIWLLCLALFSAGRSQDYFPLKAGHSWHYSSESVGFGTDGPRESHTLTVVGDTLTTEGKTYSVLIRNGFFQSKYLRVDSGSIFGLIDGMDSLLLDMEALPSDSVQYGCSIRLIAVSEEIILGVLQTVKAFGNPGCLHSETTLKLARTFGVVEYQFHPEQAPGTVDRLEGATLDGQTFGNPGAVQRIGNSRLKSKPALKHFHGTWMVSTNEKAFTVLGKPQSALDAKSMNEPNGNRSRLGRSPNPP